MHDPPPVQTLPVGHHNVSRSVSPRPQLQTHVVPDWGNAGFGASGTTGHIAASPIDVAPPHPPRIRDAEMSVDFLCRKFEALSGQLQLEEARRQELQRRSTVLNSETEAAEAAIAKRRGMLAAEVSTSESSLAALRSCANNAMQRAALQAEKVREEQAAGARFEDLCARLVDECRIEAARGDGTIARLTIEDREAVQEECEHAEASRVLRRTVADVRSVSEDLRIAQQRLLLVQSERRSFEMELQVTRRANQACSQRLGMLSAQLPERRQQLQDHEARIGALAEVREKFRRESYHKEQRLQAVRNQGRAARARYASIQEELAALQGEVGPVGTLARELQAAKAQHGLRKQEVLAHEAAFGELGVALAAARRAVGGAHQASAALGNQVQELTAQEQRYAAIACGLRKARHAEDLAFEDVHGELQSAFRRGDSLAEEISAHARARDVAATQLRRLRPEIEEADERCSVLEGHLAQRAHDLESELMRQRRSQQELATASEALRALRRREAYLRLQFEESTAGAGRLAQNMFSSDQNGASHFACAVGIGDSMRWGWGSSSSPHTGGTRRSPTPNRYNRYAAGAESPTPAALPRLTPPAQAAQEAIPLWCRGKAARCEGVSRGGMLT